MDVKSLFVFANDESNGRVFVEPLCHQCLLCEDSEFLTQSSYLRLTGVTL